MVSDAGWREQAVGSPPCAATIESYDQLSERLRALRAWAGVSYRELHRRVVHARKARGVAELPVYNTVYRCLQPGRSTVDDELVADIAAALLGDRAAAEPWRLACHAIDSGTPHAAAVAVADGLPDDLSGFTGRKAELAELLDMLRTGSPGNTMAITAIGGMAGVGKTTLAVRAAHALLADGRFPDLCLSVNLRGFDAEAPPADPDTVLAAFVHRLGVPASQVDTLDPDRRAALYRSLLAGKRALLLLDNAASAEQVRPLLPNDPSCLVLVTSRRRLDGPDGLPATHLPLDVFRREESIELMREVAGAELIDADPGCAAAIAELVGHLPLALSLVASRIRALPDWTLADHLTRLTERKKHLQVDDGVRIAVSVSYDNLPAAHQRLLRLLALHPGQDVDRYAAAALAGADLADTDAALASLTAASLLRERVRGRFELHDLIQVFAADRARDEDPRSDRHAAMTRLLDHYRHTALLAMNRYAPHEAYRQPEVPDPGTPRPDFADRASATAWLEAERANLLAAAGHADAHGWPAHTGHLSVILFRFLDLSGRHFDAAHLHAMASRTADPGIRARATTNLGIAYLLLSRHHAAAEQFTKAVALLRGLGDQIGAANALINLGATELYLGQLAEAGRQFQQAADSAAEAGDRVTEGRALGNVGVVHYLLGRYHDAIEVCRRTLAITRETGDRTVEAAALIHLGAARHKLGEGGEALRCLLAGLELAREVGHRVGEADALNQLGVVHAGLGDLERAMEYHRQAMAIATDDGVREIQVQVLNAMGHTHLASGDVDRAVGCHRRALTLAGELGDRYEQARAHAGIGDCAERAAAAGTAAEHWREAHALFSRVGTPEATAMAGRLRKQPAVST